MIKKLDHINAVVADLDAAVAFFEQLDFVLEDRARLCGEWISDVVGLPEVQAEYAKLSHTGSPTKLELIRYDQPKSGVDPDAHLANQMGWRHIAFEVTDIEAEVSRLQAAGVSFLSPVHVYPVSGKKLVYARGPEGLIVEFAQYPAQG